STASRRSSRCHACSRSSTTSSTFRRARRSAGSPITSSPSPDGRPAMSLRARLEALFETQVVELTESGAFRALETGAAAPADYDRFLADVVRTHLKATEY